MTAAAVDIENLSVRFGASTVVRGVSRDRSDHPNCQWRLGLTVH